MHWAGDLTGVICDWRWLLRVVSFCCVQAMNAIGEEPKYSWIQCSVKLLLPLLIYTHSVCAGFHQRLRAPRLQACSSVVGDARWSYIREGGAASSPLGPAGSRVLEEFFGCVWRRGGPYRRTPYGSPPPTWTRWPHRRRRPSPRVSAPLPACLPARMLCPCPLCWHSKRARYSGCWPAAGWLAGARGWV